MLGRLVVTALILLGLRIFDVDSCQPPADCLCGALFGWREESSQLLGEARQSQAGALDQFLSRGGSAPDLPPAIEGRALHSDEASLAQSLDDAAHLRRRNAER